MSDVRIGVVGLAFGACHVDTIGNIEGARVAAVADNAPLRAKKISVAEYAASIGAAAYDDGIRMINEAEIDAVDLAVSPKFREPLLRAAAKRGLPVMIEKPMANNVPQAELFAKIAADAGIPLMIEYPMRFHPAMQRMKQLLEDGTLGAPLSATADMQTMWNPPVGHWSWADDAEGGWITECGCHMLDTVCFLCGSPQSVFASGRNVQGHGKTVDTVAMNIDFANGCSTLINAGGIATFAFNVPMYVKLYCEKGEALVSGENWVFNNVRWALHGPDEKVHDEAIPGPPRGELLRQSMMEFVKVVRDHIAPPCPAEDGLVVQKVINAMVRSIENRKAEVV